MTTTAFQIPLEDFICISPLLFLFLGSLIPLAVKVLRGNKEPHPAITLCLSLIGVVAALGVSFSLFPKAVPHYAFSNALVFDGVSFFASILICLVTAAAAVMAKENAATMGDQFTEFLFLLLNSAVGMMLVAWSNDLIVTFIAIEIMSLCLYLLIALSHEERLSKEAALKYFVLGSFASAIFLYGIAFIYGLSGSTYLNIVSQFTARLMHQNPLFIIGVALALIGFCFKVAIVPFHAWTPDVYEGAPTPVTGFMATGVKVVVFVAFLRFIHLDFLGTDKYHHLLPIVEWLAVLTMTVGNIAAILQTNFKRMLAYSSIAHSGYVMMGLVVAGLAAHSQSGTEAVVYYVFAYTIMTLGAFGIVALFEKKEDDMSQIEDFRGLSRRNPWAAVMLTVFLLSLAGVPPTIGFFAKFFVFSAVIKQGLYWLAVWGAINAAISAYYYLRPIVYMFMRDEDGIVAAEHHTLTWVMTAIMAVLTLVLGLATEPVYEAIKLAAHSLF